jgi:hypothetical protein
MARLFVSGNYLHIALSDWEHKRLDRPELRIEMSKITAVTLDSGIERAKLVNRVSRRNLLGGVQGLYRANSRTLLVLGNSQAEKALVIAISYPTIDEIIYSNKDAEAVYEKLTRK